MKSSETSQTKGIINQFKQQLMKAWQPVPTLNKTIVIFALLGAVFITLGILIATYATKISEYYVRYDSCKDATCTYEIVINTDMPAPVFFFYELRGFYQNHRLYISSISLNQLKGENLTVQDISKDCSPIVKNSDLYKNMSITNQSLDRDGPANPCGLIALSLFNDSFTVSNSSGNLEVTSKGIAWPSDIQMYKPSNPSQMWTDTTDQRFMVWMRVAALPSFRKVWGRVNTDVAAGTYTLTVQNNYDVTQFGAEKWFVLAESNVFGSKDVVMSISYLSVGGACIVFMITFGIIKIRKVLRARSE